MKQPNSRFRNKISDRRAIHANKSFIMWVITDFLFFPELFILGFITPTEKVENAAYGMKKEEMKRAVLELKNENFYNHKEMKRNFLGFLDSHSYNAMIYDVREKYDNVTCLGARLIIGRLILDKQVS